MWNKAKKRNHFKLWCLVMCSNKTVFCCFSIHCIKFKMVSKLYFLRNKRMTVSLYSNIILGNLNWKRVGCFWNVILIELDKLNRRRGKCRITQKLITILFAHPKLTNKKRGMKSAAFCDRSSLTHEWMPKLAVQKIGRVSFQDRVGQIWSINNNYK